MRKLDPAEVQAAAPAGWRQLGSRLCIRYRTPDFSAGLALLNRIGEQAEAADHHPDAELSFGHLDLRLTSHDVGGITQRDLDLARAISGLAGDANVRPDTAALTQVELALDTTVPARLRPFWAALLGSRDTGDEVRDPDGALPDIWFQVPEGQGGDGEVEQRWHLDVWVAHDHAESRARAAIAAGGTLVDDSQAPTFWVLADADGNRSCICTPLVPDPPETGSG